MPLLVFPQCPEASPAVLPQRTNRPAQGSRPVQIFFAASGVFFAGQIPRQAVREFGWPARKKKLGIPAAGPGLTQLCPDLFSRSAKNNLDRPSGCPAMRKNNLDRPAYHRPRGKQNPDSHHIMMVRSNHKGGK